MGLLEKVSLACTVMDVEQLETLFELISKDSKIKELDLLDTDLTGIGAELMGSAVNKLEKVNLSGSKLTGEQLNPMVEQFDFKVLKEVSIDYLDMSDVSNENTCKLLKSLEKISLKKANIKTEQINEFFRDLSLDDNVTLKDLNLHGNNLKDVSSLEVENAITKLISVDLSHTNIPLEVIAQVFKALSSSKFTKLRNIVLAGNNLENIDVKVIAGALTNLDKLDLSSSELSTSQLNTILSAVVPPLKELSLFNIKMENVAQDILEAAKDVAFINYRCKSP